MICVTLQLGWLYPMLHAAQMSITTRKGLTESRPPALQESVGVVVVVVIIRVMMVVVMVMAGHRVSDCRATYKANHGADRTSHDCSAHSACNSSSHRPA